MFVKVIFFSISFSLSVAILYKFDVYNIYIPSNTFYASRVSYLRPVLWILNTTRGEIKIFRRIQRGIHFMQVKFNVQSVELRRSMDKKYIILYLKKVETISKSPKDL